VDGGRLIGVRGGEPGSTPRDAIKYMRLHRVVAVILFAIAFLTLLASRAFRARDNIPVAVEIVIVVVGVACFLIAVPLWFRKAPGTKA
jgi:4-hydroxybenzoate polyprenyltransferase